jgi:uncharacterized protein (UPF0335 family)
MTDAHGVARDQLRAFIERIERLEEEKKTIADDIKDVYGEAKGMGFDTKIMKMVIALRKKDDQERTEQEMILDTYLAALGMIPEPFEPEDEASEPEPAVKHTAMALRSPREEVDEISEPASTVRDDLPCGSCAAGVYHEVPVLKGLEMFGHCETRKQALAEAPRCKCGGSHICFGARDWILAMEFPITKARRAEIMRECGSAEEREAA